MTRPRPRRDQPPPPPMAQTLAERLLRISQQMVREDRALARQRKRAGIAPRP